MSAIPPAASSTPYLGELVPSRCVLLLCDLQERFRPSIVHFDEVVENAARMVRVANIMNIPIIGTEQYPKARQITTTSTNVQAYAVKNFLLLQLSSTQMRRPHYNPGPRQHRSSHQGAASASAPLLHAQDQVHHAGSRGRGEAGRTRG